jgi:predicted Rossmann-fold nucleotide-binding protein
MQAANEGAAAAAPELRDRSIGVRIQLEFEQHTNPFVGQAYEHRTFFSRLHHFVLLSHAFVVVPGGIGTTLEALMIWQLLQVRKLYGTPLIMIGRMWPDFVEWAREHMLGVEPHLADPVDLSIPRCVAGVDEAVAIIREYHETWVRDRASMTSPTRDAAGPAPGGAPPGSAPTRP